MSIYISCSILFSTPPSIFAISFKNFILSFVFSIFNPLFNTFKGFSPKDVITVSSYSLDNLPTLIASEIKKVIGKV